MAVRTIIEYPNPHLRNISGPVTTFDDSLHELVADMFETMAAAEGIGLAAIQVDVPLQLIVVDVNEEEHPPVRLAAANPRIVLAEGKASIEEGCLSVPMSYRAAVQRYEHVVVEYQDENGADQTVDATGLAAICLQHEIDHLKGRLFIDRISSLKRGLYDKKLAKYNRYKKREEREQEMHR